MRNGEVNGQKGDVHASRASAGVPLLLPPPPPPPPALLLLLLLALLVGAAEGVSAGKDAAAACRELQAAWVTSSPAAGNSQHAWGQRKVQPQCHGWVHPNTHTSLHYNTGIAG